MCHPQPFHPDNLDVICVPTHSFNQGATAEFPEYKCSTHFLLDHCGQTFSLLWAAPLPPPDRVQLNLIAEWRARGLPLRVLGVGYATGTTGIDVVIEDPDRRIAAR